MISKDSVGFGCCGLCGIVELDVCSGQINVGCDGISYGGVPHPPAQFRLSKQRSAKPGLANTLHILENR